MKKLLLPLVPFLLLGCIASESGDTIAGGSSSSSVQQGTSQAIESSSSVSITSSATLSSAHSTSSTSQIVEGLQGAWAEIMMEGGEVVGEHRMSFSATTFEMELDMNIGTGNIPFIALSGNYSVAGNQISLVPTQCMTIDMDAMLQILLGGEAIEGPIPLSVDCMQPSEEDFSMGMNEPMIGTYQIVGNTLTITPEPDPENPEDDEPMTLQRQ